MPDTPNPILRQLDLIQLRTIARVSYLSAKPGESASPHGTWSVVGLIGADVVAAKDGIIIRIPMQDVERIGSSDYNQVLEEMRRLTFTNTEVDSGKRQEQG